MNRSRWTTVALVVTIFTNQLNLDDAFNADVFILSLIHI